MSDDEPDFDVDINCIDVQTGTFVYYVFQGKDGCDHCHDHSTAVPCDPPPKPHPGCCCDIVPMIGRLPSFIRFRCEFLGVEEQVESGDADVESLHLVSDIDLPGEFHSFIDNPDWGLEELDELEQQFPDEALGNGFFRFSTPYTGRVGHYEGGEGGEDEEEDYDPDEDAEDADISQCSGDVPELATDTSGSRAADLPASFTFHLQDLNEGSWVNIHYAVSYVRYDISYMFYMVVTLGGEEYEIPLFEHVQHKYLSTGVDTIGEPTIGANEERRRR
jgi:hypothetical protein